VTTIIDFSSINLEPQEQEILRIMGYRRSQAPTPEVERLVTGEKGRSYSLLEPRGIYTIRRITSKGEEEVTLEDGTTFKGWNVARALRGAQEAALFVVTVGEKISQRVRSLFDSRHFAEAVCLDAVASVAVDALAEYMHREVIWKEAQDRGLFIGPRYSPGYCFWKLEEQARLFAALGPEAIGVHLNSHFFMIPEKSISAVVGMGSEEREIRISACADCSVKDCSVRR